MSLRADQYIFYLREQRGVTTDLGSDPTLVSRNVALSSASYNLDPFRLIPISHAHVVVMKRTLYPYFPSNCNADSSLAQCCFLPRSIKTKRDAHDPLLCLHEMQPQFHGPDITHGQPTGSYRRFIAVC